MTSEKERHGVMTYVTKINGLTVKTGDIICTTDGGAPVLAGQFWRFIGKIVPGDVDHVAIYIGPGGRCVESGAKGRVNSFEVTGEAWDPFTMKRQRGGVIDTLYGIAYPLAGRGLTEQKENEIRQAVAGYCLAQAEARKPYNLNFLNSKTEDAFYCSQLAYQAYLKHGIDLNTGMGVPDVPGTESIIFPQEIWSGCVHAEVAPQDRPGAFRKWLSRVREAVFDSRA
jgi:hypothetical protein